MGPPAALGVAEGQRAALPHGQLWDAATTVAATGSCTLLTQRDPMCSMGLGAPHDFYALPLPLEGGLTALRMTLLHKQKHSLGSFIISWAGAFISILLVADSQHLDLCRKSALNNMRALPRNALLVPTGTSRQRYNYLSSGDRVAHGVLLQKPEHFHIAQ